MNNVQKLSAGLLATAAVLSGWLGVDEVAQAQIQAMTAYVTQQCTAAGAIYAAAVGQTRVVVMDVSGNICVSGAGAGGGGGGTVAQGTPASGTFGAAWPVYTPNGASSITTGTVSITSGATQILAALPGPYAYKGICVITSTGTVYLGSNSGVTSGNSGMQIGGTTNPSCWNLTKFPGTLYGITSGGTASATVGYEYY